MVADYSYLSSKDQAFKMARKELGIRKKFKFNGKVYWTDTAEDVNSPLFEFVPLDDNKYKIEDNKVWKWDNNAWAELVKKDNAVIEKEDVKSYNKLDLKKPKKTTRKQLLDSIYSNAEMRKKYPDVISAMDGKNEEEAWRILVTEKPVYKTYVNDDVNIEEGLMKGMMDVDQAPAYDSLNPFYNRGQVDISQLQEFMIHTREYEEIEGIKRDGGTYSLIKLTDETKNPDEPKIMVDIADNLDAFNLLLRMPNNKQDAQKMGLGLDWELTKKYYDEGYRLVDENGAIQRGYKEEASHMEIFTIDTSDINWTFQDMLKEDKQGDWVKKLPFVGDAVKIAELSRLFDAVARLEEEQRLGTDVLTYEDLQLLKKYYDESRRNPDWGGLIYEIMSNLPAFATELYLSAGMTKGATKITKKAIQTTLDYIVSKTGVKFLKSKLAKMSVDATSNVIGTTVAWTGVMGSLKTVEGSLSRMLPLVAVGYNDREELNAIILEEGMGISDSIGWSAMDNTIEVLTERLGGAIPPKMREKLARYSFAHLFQKLNPNLSQKQFKKVIEQAGFHGVAEEMIEEEVGRGARGIVHMINDGDESFEYKLPTWKELSSQFVAFSLNPLSVAGTGVNYMANGRNIAIAKSVEKVTKRGDKLFIKGFNNRDSVKEVNRAVKKNVIDVNTGNYIKLILAHGIRNGQDFDTTSMIKIHNKAKLIFRESWIEKIQKEKNISYKQAEKEWEDFLIGENVKDPTSTTVVQALGKTSVIDLKDGNNKILLDIFAGANNNTIIEEFLGVHYKLMTDAEHKDYIENIYNKANTKLTEQEYFEKTGVDYILDSNSLLGDNPLIKYYKQAKKYIKNLFNSISEDYELPDNVQALYENIFPSGVESETKNTETVKEVRNVNKKDTESYDLVPVKDVAIRLASNSILSEDLVKDKNLRNKVINRGVLKGYREIMKAIIDGNVNLNEAQTWYSDEVKATMDLMKEEIPEIDDYTGADEIFAKMVLAITSNGQKVRPNYNQAVGIIKDYYKNGEFTYGDYETDIYIEDPEGGKDKIKSGKKKLVRRIFYTTLDGRKELVGGLRSETIMETLERLDSLIKEYGMEGAMRWLLEKHHGEKIRQIVKKGGNIRKTWNQYGAEVLGEKVGAFALNLNGISELPTYDLWWNRTWNRWMGTPLKKSGKELQEDVRNPAERKAMTEVLNTIANKLTNNKEFNETGEQINPEDVQALLWYLEKDLYIKSGAIPSELISFRTVAQERSDVLNAKSTTPKSVKKPEQTSEARNIKSGEKGKIDKESKDRDKSIRESIKRGDSYQITAFHGSDTGLIKKFDPDKTTRTGLQQGWGTYLANAYEVARHYALQGYDPMNPQSNPTTYKVIVHKGKTPKEYDYLDWNDSPNESQTKKIFEYAEHNLTPEQLDVLLNLYSSRFSGDAEYESIVWGAGKTYNAIPDGYFMNLGGWMARDIFEAMTTMFYKQASEKGLNPGTSVKQSQKEVSMFMLKAGIDGLIFQSGVKPAGLPATKDNQKSYVVFDADEIEIQSKKSYQLKKVSGRLDLAPETVGQWFFQKIVDKYHRMKVIQDTVKRISPDTDVYLKMVQFPGKTKFKIEKVEKEVEKIVKAVIKAGFTLEQFEDYLYSLHAISRNKEIRKRTKGENNEGSGMSDEDALNIREEYDGTQLEKLAKRFHKTITEKRLELLRTSGLITQEQYDKYKDQWENYVPLKSESTVGRIIQNVRSGFNVLGSDVHPAGGRTTRARNVLFQAVADYQETIKRVEQQTVVKSLARLIEKNDLPIWKIKRPVYVKSKPIWDEDGNFEYIQQKQLADNEVGFREIDADGRVKQYIIQIDDSSTVVRDNWGTIVRNPLVTTINNLGIEKSSVIMNKINSFLRRNYTTWSPDFIVSNFERDLQTAFYNLNTDYDPKIALQVMNDVRKALVGIYKETRGFKKKGFFGNEWKNIYKDYKRNGGQMGWFDSKSIEEKIKETERNIKRASQTGNTRKAISFMVKWIEDVNETVEQAVRVATYKRMQMNGMSKADAVAVAKDLTINFNRKGEWGSLINSFYLFFNAGVQGAVNTGKRAFMTPTGGAIASGLLGAGMLNSFINKQVCSNYDEEISSYEKDNYMIFMRPDCTIGFKLRLPYGWGMFKTIGGVLYDYNDGSIDLAEASSRVFVSASHSFNPMGGGTIMQTISPTISDPLVMTLGEGKDFKGDDLYPREYSPNKTPNFTKHKKFTSDIYIDGAKWLSDMTGGNDFQGGLIDASPETYKTWTNFLGGGFINNLQRSWSTGASLIRDGRLPRVRNDENKINWNEIPIIRQHVAQPKTYLRASKVWDMMENADIILYSRQEVERFKDFLYKAVQSGDIDFNKAYGKHAVDTDGDGIVDTGEKGLQTQFLERQTQLWNNLNRSK